MRIRLSWLAVVLLLIPSPTRADDHFADSYFGLSGTNASSLVGFHQTFAWAVEQNKRFSLVLSDVGVAFGSHEEADATQVTLLGGLRYNRRVHDRHLVFGQVLAGLISTAIQSADNDTGPAIAFGGGWEPGLGTGETRDGHVSTAWAARLQVDYIVDPDRSDAIRFSAGIVYRFKKD